jgi:hypothetical protein
MYFVVPKGRSILKSVFNTTDLYKAQKHADALHAEAATRNKSEHFDVISMTSAYTTQTHVELMEQDMLLAAEAEAAATI